MSHLSWLTLPLPIWFLASPWSSLALVLLLASYVLYLDCSCNYVGRLNQMWPVSPTLLDQQCKKCLYYSRLLVQYFVLTHRRMSSVRQDDTARTTAVAVIRMETVSSDSSFYITRTLLTLEISSSIITENSS